MGVGWSPDKDGATEPLAVELPPVSVNRPTEKGGTTDPLAVEGPWVVGDRWMGRRVVVVEVLPVARDRLDPDKAWRQSWWWWSCSTLRSLIPSTRLC